MRKWISKRKFKTEDGKEFQQFAIERLKRDGEVVHWRTFRTRQEARDAIFAYIEGFYNSRRIQKRLGYMSPAGWLKHHLHLFSLSVA